MVSRKRCAVREQSQAVFTMSGSHSSIPNPVEPLKMIELSKGPWQKVNVDFVGPFPSGEYVLVVIDNYSRYS